ncbi:LPXTG cell wall anchor domain-containing protein, partial [Clostridium perfringens]|nr:LPXTG cell wall anchor domain-containing protein [Clostridium perfringens]
ATGGTPPLAVGLLGTITSLVGAFMMKRKKR